MTWGVETDADEAAAQLVAFHDAGGTLVDTAASYGYGESEAILGHLVADVVPRADLILASKAGLSRTPEGRTIDASRGALLRQLDVSLRRLGTDYLGTGVVHGQRRVVAASHRQPQTLGLGRVAGQGRRVSGPERPGHLPRHAAARSPGRRESPQQAVEARSDLDQRRQLGP